MMKNRLISRTGMLVSRSELQEALTNDGDEFYACPKCGAEYINPFKMVCGLDNGKLVRVVE